jgi:hypothetical protein
VWRLDRWGRSLVDLKGVSKWTITKRLKISRTSGRRFLVQN